MPGLRHQKHVASAKFSAAARVSNRWTQVVKSMVSFHDYFNEKNVTKNAAPLWKMPKKLDYSKIREALSLAADDDGDGDGTRR